MKSAIEAPEKTRRFFRGNERELKSQESEPQAPERTSMRGRVGYRESNKVATSACGKTDWKRRPKRHTYRFWRNFYEKVCEWRVHPNHRPQPHFWVSPRTHSTTQFPLLVPLPLPRVQLHSTLQRKVSEPSHLGGLCMHALSGFPSLSGHETKKEKSPAGTTPRSTPRSHQLCHLPVGTEKLGDPMWENAAELAHLDVG